MRLVHGFAQVQTFLMRALAIVLVAAALLFVIYQAYLKKMPTTDKGTAPTQAITLTGVRNDLIQIAQAERSNIALNTTCSSLQELVSNGSLTVEKPSRDGYTYEIQCGTGDQYTVTARHAPAPPDSTIRYPNFAIDQTMSVREIE